MRLYTYIFIVFILVFKSGFTQERVLSGIVSDRDGGMPQIIVQNLSTKDGIVTNIIGEYILKVNTNDTIIYKEQTKYKSWFRSEKRIVKPNQTKIDVRLYSFCELKEKMPCNEKEVVVLVAKKRTHIDVTNYNDPCETPFYDEVDATYKIIKKVYGHYNKPTITFRAIEHAASEPFDFLDSKYSLLVIGKFCDEYHLLRKQNIPIYKTKDNRWASRYLPNQYLKKDSLLLEDEKIAFKKKKIKLSKTDYRKRKRLYESTPKYHTLKNRKLKLLMENYVEDVFKYIYLPKLKEWEFIQE